MPPSGQSDSKHFCVPVSNCISNVLNPHAKNCACKPFQVLKIALRVVRDEICISSSHKFAHLGHYHMLCISMKADIAVAVLWCVCVVAGDAQVLATVQGEFILSWCEVEVPLWTLCLVGSALLRLWAEAGVALCRALALPSRRAVWWGAGWVLCCVALFSLAFRGWGSPVRVCSISVS
ncbi:hypothetical protein AMECASPLE_023814 [Ameca splendens]|uniref:Uncharacterized protein n=1 Tax=Ameca splendens TaxID=208324 RepID=A0ABV0XTA1_9TELE